MKATGQFSDVLWMSRYHYARGSTLLDHKHDFYQIIYFIEGNGLLHSDDERTEIENHSVLFVRPNQIHGIEITRALKTIDIKFNVTDAQFGERLGALPELIPLSDAHDTLFLMESMLEVGAEQRIYYRERCQFLLNLILMELIESATPFDNDDLDSRVYSDPPASESTLCSGLIELVDAHLDEEFDSDRLEKELGYSYRHISVHCNNEYGLTPMQLIRGRRIQKAKELLFHNNCEIKEIGRRLGFKSVYHFSRIFREHVGQPPGKWRALQLQKICRDIYIDPDYTNDLHVKTPD